MISTKRSVTKLITVLATLPAVTLLVFPHAQAQTFTVLHTFHGKNGAGPSGALLRDKAGNLYGTTEAGGAGECGNYGCGTVFKLDKHGKQVWLHSFDVTDGEEPFERLVRDGAGNLYGTTAFGGRMTCVSGCGVVFKLDDGGHETVMYKFRKPPDGYSPNSSLVRDHLGNLYGITESGGAYSSGTIFRVNKNGKEKVLHDFTGGSDGCVPVAGLISDSAGNLYGATAQGGFGLCDQGYGVVFKLDTTGTLTVLHNFDFGDGAYPESILLLDEAGNLYGTTEGGGSGECGFGGCGTVFKLSPQPDGTWSGGAVYYFCSLSGCADGRGPTSGPLARDSAGNLYGTTTFGGQSRCNGSGCGVVFKIGADGGETVIYSFTHGADGAFPIAGLTIDASGRLYGVAQNGGDEKCSPPHGCGTVFRITP